LSHCLHSTKKDGSYASIIQFLTSQRMQERMRLVITPRLSQFFYKSELLFLCSYHAYFRQCVRVHQPATASTKDELNCPYRSTNRTIQEPDSIGIDEDNHLKRLGALQQRSKSLQEYIEETRRIRKLLSPEEDIDEREQFGGRHCSIMAVFISCRRSIFCHWT
jgi:hypothetical protein